jgi:hypothetical protein
VHIKTTSGRQVEGQDKRPRKKINVVENPFLLC